MEQVQEAICVEIIFLLLVSQAELGATGSTKERVKEALQNKTLVHAMLDG